MKVWCERLVDKISPMPVDVSPTEIICKDIEDVWVMCWNGKGRGEEEEEEEV